MIIVDEQPGHAGAIETLLDTAFGPERNGKTVYRLRQSVAPAAGLSLIALEGSTLAGTIRYWPILLAGSVPALLLGPIAVASDLRCRGVGARLIGRSLNRAAALGHRAVILVGDAPYYEPFGFSRQTTLGLTLPGPVDYNRLLGLDLVPGTLDGLNGPISRWPDPSAALPPMVDCETWPHYGAAPATV
ncbi:MAG: GNAT family N-acetyltransferase [Azospirillum sp.]|nr:GNAT family N-acetyltransferase [Azospirillum sp.]